MVVCPETKNPCQRDRGEKSNEYPWEPAFPPPCREVVVNPAWAGDLARAWHIAPWHLQLRDSAGLAPASPFIFPIRGLKKPGLRSIQL